MLHTNDFFLIFRYGNSPETIWFMEWDFLFMENHNRTVLDDCGYHNNIYCMEGIKETCCEKSLMKWRNPLF